MTLGSMLRVALLIMAGLAVMDATTTEDTTTNEIFSTTEGMNTTEQGKLKMRKLLLFRMVISIYFRYIFQLNDLIMFFGGDVINGTTIDGWRFHHGKQCQPSFEMNATNLTEAKAECVRDRSCYMFYEACHDSEQTTTLMSTTSPKTSNFPSTTSPQTGTFTSTTPSHTSDFPSTTPLQTICNSPFCKCNASVETPYEETSACVLYKKGNIYI